jgi:hypothetical protein
MFQYPRAEFLVQLCSVRPDEGHQRCGKQMTEGSSRKVSRRYGVRSAVRAYCCRIDFDLGGRCRGTEHRLVSLHKHIEAGPPRRYGVIYWRAAPLRRTRTKKRT